MHLQQVKTVNERNIMAKKKKSWAQPTKVEVTKAPEAPKADEPQKLPFSAWWMLANKKITFKPWMKEIILADFKARGLTETETLDDYYAALTKFGYTI